MIRSIFTQEDIDELLLSGCGDSFATEGKWPGTFSRDSFRSSWIGYLLSGVGAIWALELDGKIVGAIGGLCYPDPNDGKPASAEAFWYVLPAYRGSTQAVRLVFVLERWAISKGSQRHSMISYETTSGSKVAEFYERAGYRKSETIYTKDLRKCLN